MHREVNLPGRDHGKGMGLKLGIGQGDPLDHINKAPGGRRKFLPLFIGYNDRTGHGWVGDSTVNYFMLLDFISKYAVCGMRIKPILSLARERAVEVLEISRTCRG